MTLGEITLVEGIGSIATGTGEVIVVFTRSAARYRLPARAAGFEESLLTLFRAWRDDHRVEVTVVGTEIRSVHPAADEEPQERGVYPF